MAYERKIGKAQMQRVTEFELLFRTKHSNFFLHDYFFIFNFQRELSGIKLAWNILSVRPGLIRQVSTCLIRLKSGLTCPFHHHNHYSNGKILIFLKDYGCPMKPSFIKIQNFLAWADKLADKFWAFGVFSAQLSAFSHFGTVSPLHHLYDVISVFNYSIIISTKH